LQWTTVGMRAYRRW